MCRLERAPSGGTACSDASGAPPSSSQRQGRRRRHRPRAARRGCPIPPPPVPPPLSPPSHTGGGTTCSGATTRVAHVFCSSMKPYLPTFDLRAPSGGTACSDASGAPPSSSQRQGRRRRHRPRAARRGCPIPPPVPPPLSPPSHTGGGTTCSGATTRVALVFCSSMKPYLPTFDLVFAFCFTMLIFQLSSYSSLGFLYEHQICCLHSMHAYCEAPA
ncbi:hypothetical protein SORBI_3004G239750 [Sorghum bicolor]|uniref:Uncharacterized protein n=1 Tax=Sorghum bicolor TaxID=4558 RepID=A0A1Z5RNU5_SORBI|nr:hypothetical protein SORBI_3004G239750 [Sorghum bicolor]